MVWKKAIEVPFGESTYVVHRAFIADLRSYGIALHVKSKGWYEKTYMLESDGFQVPHRESLDTWMEADRRNGLDFEDAGNAMQVDSVAISWPVECDGTALRLGYFEIVTSRLEEIEFYHPLFETITTRGQHTRFEKDLLWQPSGLPVMMVPMSIYSLYGLEHTTFFIKKTRPNATIDEIMDIKRRMFRRILSLYPYYRERELSKADLLIRFEELCKIGSNQAFMDGVGRLLQDIHDPHLYLVQERAQRTVRPVVAKEFDEGIQIVAVFDERYRGVMPVGSEILMIDGVQTEVAIERLAEDLRGNYRVRRRKAISRMLRKPPGEQVVLTVLTPENEERHLRIEYRPSSIKTPKNILPPDGRLDVTSNSKIGYLRLAKWRLGTWNHIYNLGDRLKQLEGLVIDLRSNGGGEGITALRFASVFLDRPTIVRQEYSPAAGRTETLVLTPNKLLRLGMPVAILINGGTASASEDFIIMMREYAEAVLVGSRTAGAVGGMISIQFEDGTAVNANVWDVPQHLTGERYSVNGVEPDIHVHMESHNDLGINNDKIRAVALRYLDGVLGAN